MEGPTRSGERRDPNDRRWGSDRRRDENPIPPFGSYSGHDERRDAGRRSDDNRRVEDRRAVSLPPFDEPYNAQILAAVHKTGAPPACPVCNSTLVLGPVVDYQEHPTREIQCPTCRRGVVAEGLT